ncbi:MAG: alpha/beta hydrolase [Myxococcales bacterium]|nr:alpha/beta hydrolase [Myxococcales bacterium]
MRLTRATLLFVGTAAVALGCSSSNSAQRPKTSATPRTQPTPVRLWTKVTLGGVAQQILARGDDATLPLLLWLHGGPGNSEIPLSHVYGPALERHFIVVHWDQRGAGRSYAASAPPRDMSVDRFVRDSKELALWLRQRFKSSRLFLLGHSWGTVVGALAAARYPKLFDAYVAVAQVTNLVQIGEAQRRLAFERAKRQSNAAASARFAKPAAKRPPSLPQLLETMKLVASLGGNLYKQTGYGRFAQIMKASKHPLPPSARGATLFSLKRLWSELWRLDVSKDAKRFEMPVYLLIGRHDLQVPPPTVVAYAASVAAPRKAVVWFDSSAHWPQLEQPRRFERVLVCKLLQKGCAR